MCLALGSSIACWVNRGLDRDQLNAFKFGRPMACRGMLSFHVSREGESNRWEALSHHHRRGQHFFKVKELDRDAYLPILWLPSLRFTKRSG
eukprot:scaffold317609_cov18-Prasinocladus_malaysianus.AAC.1